MSHIINIRFSVIYITFFLINSFSFGQMNESDSLKQKLLTSESDSKKANTLIQISDYYLYKNTDSVIYYANKSLEIAKKLKDINLLYLSYTKLSEGYYDISKLNKSLNYIIKAEEIAEQLENDELIAKALNVKGAIFQFKGNFYEAFDAYNKSLSISRRLNKENEIASNLHNLGLIFHELEDNESAIKYIEESVNIAKSFSDNFAYSYYVINLAFIYGKNRETDKAKNLAKKVSELTENTINKNYFDNYINIMLSDIEYNDGNYSKSIKLLEENIKSYDLGDNTYIDFAETYCHLSKNYLKLENFSEAKAYAYKTLLDLEGRNNMLYYDTYKVLYDSFSIEKNKDSIIKYTPLYIAYKDSINLQSKSNLFFKERIKLTEQELSLKKDQAVKLASFEAKQKNITNILRITTISIFAIFLLMLFYSRKLRIKNSRINKVLEDKFKLENTIEKIENTIAKDFHDNFGNRVTSALTSYSIVKELAKNKNSSSKDILRFLDMMEKSLEPLSNDIKDLLWSINPENNKLTPLINRLEKITKEMNKVYDGEIRFKIITIGDVIYKLPKLANRQILLIVKESLNNAIKHSNSEKVDLFITVTNNDFLSIVCKDYGIGFDIDRLKRINGLNNLKERANLIDFNIEMKSEENNGTTIKLSSKRPLQVLV